MVEIGSIKTATDLVEMVAELVEATTIFFV